MLCSRAATIVATFAFLLAGCGSATDASAPAASPQDKLEPGACVELSNASLDLGTSTSAEEAESAANVFEKYHPSADAQEGIDHLVQAGGVTFDGTDFDMISRIDAWVREVCPE